MTRRKESNIIPLHKDKFYVYALFKPQDFNPFYVGKGIGERVNDHFKPSNLKKNTPKTGVIKKYGDKIRREILVYFDCEESAYAFEEYLISLYGLLSEGGCLVNYAKTRFEYSDKFVSDFSSIGHLSRKRKHSKEDIMSILKRFYIDKQSKQQISKDLNIEENYLGYVLRGAKCKLDFKSFLDLNHLSPEDYCLIYKDSTEKSKDLGREKIQKVSDDEIIREFNLFISGMKTMEQIADTYASSVKYFDSIFRGVDRSKIPIDHEKYKKIVNTRKKFTKSEKTKIEDLITLGLSCAEVMSKTGMSKTSFHRIKNKMKNKSDGMATPGEGTSTNVSGQDTTSNNLENAA